MKETQASIERVKRVNKNYQRLELAVDASLAGMLAGQALLVRRIEKDSDIQNWHPYLREMWFPVDIPARDVLVVERAAKVRYLPGQLLSLLGPIGQPFRFRRTLRNILLLVYDTPPTPLLLMLPSLLASQVSVTMILMGRAVDYDARHLPEEIEVICAEDDLTWPDMVMTLGWADQIFVLVRPGSEGAYFAQAMQMLRARRSDIPPNTVFGVFQNLLPCGVGACHACMLRTRQGPRLQCMDGPAFDLTAVRLD